MGELKSKCCEAKLERWDGERVGKYTRLEPSEQLFCQQCGHATEIKGNRTLIE